VTAAGDAHDYRRALALARARSDAGAWDEAARLWAAVVERNPFHGGMWQALAGAREKSGDRAGALTAHARTLELGHGSPAESAYAIARCHAAMGDRERAVEWLERALALGYRDLAGAREDVDLAPLRDDPRIREQLGLVDREAMSRDEGWCFDLRYLAREVRRRGHPMRAAQVAGVEVAAHELAGRVGELTDHQLVVEVMRLVAMLADGHSSARSEEESFTKTLPLLLFWFEEGLHVVAAAPRYRGLVGSRLLRVGSRPVEDVVESLRPVIGRDNEYGLRQVVAFRLLQPPLLHALGLIPEPDRAELELAGIGGSVEAVTVEHDPAWPPQRRVLSWPCPDEWVHLPRTLAAPLPLSLRNPSLKYWFEHLPAHDLVYFQLNRVMDDPAEPLRDFTERLFARLEGHRAARLAIDLRWNPGGNTFLLLPLLRRIVGSPVLGVRGRLFVLIGRGTGSAAQNFATMLERYAMPTFVGEPTGSSPNFVGETVPFELPWSGVHVNVSDLYWQTSWPMDHRTWIAPDLAVPPTFEAYRRNEDPALGAILAWREELPGS
jgi:hypothetical protein